MYANNNPWGPSPSSGSGLPANNPFLESSAANRFPVIDSQQTFQSSSSYPSPSPLSSQQQQSSYGAQQHPGWNNLQPQVSTYGAPRFSVYDAPQPQSPHSGYTSFGQQYDQQLPYGGLQTQSAGYSAGYPPYQQNVMSPQQYQEHQQSVISQFDPFGGSVNGQQSQDQPLTSASQVVPSPGSPRTGPSGQQHPRLYIQSHKGELESWNASSWKQALLTFEELKRSWEMRRAEIQRQLLAGHYLTGDDIAHLNQLSRNAESNIDSVVASLIQMQEVFSGYKLSLDAASKKRVREALNAGLQGLPEWP